MFVTEVFLFYLLSTFCFSQGQLSGQKQDQGSNAATFNDELGRDVKSSGGYYYVLSPELSWTESREWCQNWGGDLATTEVKTFNGRREILDMISASGIVVWLGGIETTQTDVFYWLDVTAVASSEWANGDPNNRNGQQNCLATYLDLELQKRYQLADGTCSDILPGLCQKKQ